MSFPGRFYLVLVLLLLAVLQSTIAQHIEKNETVTYAVQESDEIYEITYRFMDHFMNYQTYQLSLPIQGTDHMIEKFGIPNWLFDPYVDNAHNRIIREREIQKGLFTLNGQTIEVDKSAVLDYYSATFAQPIAKMIVSSLADYGADTRTNRIEFAIRFVQDIPYGVPEYQDAERHFGGVHCPPQLLIKGYGDCDSKVLLFVGILSYLIPAEEILFLNQKEHVLSAILGNPEKGQTYVSFNNKEFLIAETAGPGKRLWGEKGNYYRERFSIETLKIKAPDVLPFEKNTGNLVIPSPISGIEDNILLIQNDAPKTFRFQISTDNRSWETIVLNSRESGKYIFNQKALVFLRFQENRRKHVTYRVHTGSSYTIYWNKWKNKWEILVRQS